jgi:hypothetical protein
VPTVLQITPESANHPETDLKEDDALYCAACGHLATRGRWRIAVNGDHAHTLANPAGLIFRVDCYKEAPGARAVGPPTDEFTWFRGYDWQVALCADCEVQLGWQFTGDDSPAVFFGLIRPRLTDKKP